MLFSSGNSAGIISSNVYPKNTAPRYFEGHGVAVGFSFLAIVCALTISIANRRENARKDREYGTVAEDGSDANPNKVLSPEKRARWGLDGLTPEQVIELGDHHPGALPRLHVSSCNAAHRPCALNLIHRFPILRLETIYSFLTHFPFGIYPSWVHCLSTSTHCLFNSLSSFFVRLTVAIQTIMNFLLFMYFNNTRFVS